MAVVSCVNSWLIQVAILLNLCHEGFIHQLDCTHPVTPTRALTLLSILSGSVYFESCVLSFENIKAIIYYSELLLTESDRQTLRCWGYFLVEC